MGGHGVRAGARVDAGVFLRVRLDGVTKRFGARAVLRDLSCAFGPGVHLLVGPNGSGKTTLLNLVAGVLAPDAGTVDIDGVSGAAARDRVFLVPSATPAIPWLTGRACIDFTASLFATREPAAAVNDVVSRLGLAPFFDKPLGEMSSGTAKEVLIAAAFASGAPVVLFDEPTNELDAASIAFFLDLLGASNRTILVATHHVEQFSRFAADAFRLEPAAAA